MDSLGAFLKKIKARHDWTAGMLDNGNTWRKFRVATRSHSLRPPVLYLVTRSKQLIGLEAEGLLT